MQTQGIVRILFRRVSPNKRIYFHCILIQKLADIANATLAEIELTKNIEVIIGV